MAAEDRIPPLPAEIVDEDLARIVAECTPEEEDPKCDCKDRPETEEGGVYYTVLPPALARASSDDSVTSETAPTLKNEMRAAVEQLATAAGGGIRDRARTFNAGVLAVLRGIQAVGVDQDRSKYDNRFCMHDLLSDAHARGATSVAVTSLLEFGAHVRAGGDAGERGRLGEVHPIGEEDMGEGDPGGPAPLGITTHHARLLAENMVEFVNSALSAKVEDLLRRPERDSALLVMVYLVHLCRQMPGRRIGWPQ